MDFSEARLGLFYSDSGYLHFQEAFDKVLDKTFLEEVVTGPRVLYLMAGKCRQK